jgi:amino acid transporter
VSDSVTPSNDAAPQLLKVLTFTDLLVYGLVYVAPIAVWSTWKFTANLSGGAVALAYTLGAVALSFTACSYGKMAVEVPEAGSAYSYARVSMGEMIGFLTGWMVLLDYLLVPALMFVFCGAALGQFMPILPAWGWILITAGYSILVNWFGIRTSANFNFATLVFQFLLVFVLLVAGIYTLHHTGSPMFTRSAWWGAASTPRSVFTGASLGLLAYLGFDAITTLTAEVRPEQRHLVGGAVIGTLALLGGLGVLQAWVLNDLSAGLTFKDPTTATFVTLGERVSPQLGSMAAWAAALIVAISIIPPMMTGVSRVLYAMAKQGELPNPLAHLHPIHRIPDVALLVAGALAIAIALYFANQFDTLTSMVNVGALAAFIAVNASVIALFRIKRHSSRLIGHFLSPAAGIVALLAVMVTMSRLALAVGAVWLLLGGVVHRINRRRGVMPRIPAA